MKVGIVGLPNVGKSSLFNALTGSYAAEAANFPFCTIEPNVGIVSVQDERLTILQNAVGAARTVPVAVEFVDIAGLVEGASRGEGLGNKFLSHIRSTDAVLQVVRAFSASDVHHVNGSINPIRDREIIATELILADVETLERRMGDAEKRAKSGDRDAQSRLEAYQKVHAALLAGTLAVDVDLTDEEREGLYDLHLLTLKPFVYAVNVDEDRLNATPDELRAILGLPNASKANVVAVCVRFEVDMMGFSAEERAEYMADMGISGNPLDALIKTCYDALGLQYYFTAGEQEVRAWTVRRGAKAPEAAGVIHSDFEKKFIKADVVNWEDLVASGGWWRAREAGKVRMEGKEYVMREGDVVLFKTGA